MVIFEVMFTLTVIVATIIGTAFFVWQFAIVLTLLVVAFVVASYLGPKFIRPRQKERSKAYTKISAQLSDSVSNMFAVKIDSREAYETMRINKSIENMEDKEFAVRS